MVKKFFLKHKHVIFVLQSQLCELTHFERILKSRLESAQKIYFFGLDFELIGFYQKFEENPEIHHLGKLERVLPLKKVIFCIFSCLC